MNVGIMQSVEQNLMQIVDQLGRHRIQAFGPIERHDADIVVAGEVNNEEDKPKLFPVEVMPLEDAPKKFTLQVHFRLNMVHMTNELFDQLLAIAEEHSGKCPLFLCCRRPGSELIFIEANDRFGVTPSLELQTAIDELLGEETYYAKVDHTLPERQKRRWERKAEPVGA